MQVNSLAGPDLRIAQGAKFPGAQDRGRAAEGERDERVSDILPGGDWLCRPNSALPSVGRHAEYDYRKLAVTELAEKLPEVEARVVSIRL